MQVDQQNVAKAILLFFRQEDMAAKIAKMIISDITNITATATKPDDDVWNCRP